MSKDVQKTKVLEFEQQKMEQLRETIESADGGRKRAANKTGFNELHLKFDFSII